MSSASSDDSGDDVPKKKAKKYFNKAKVFQLAWLENENYKKRLERVEGNKEKCRCKVCNAVINFGKSELERHRTTKKHESKMKAVVTTPLMKGFLKKHDPLETQVKTAELIVSAFYAEHNIAFQTIDHLVPALQKSFPDSKILHQVRLGRTKCTEIVKNVLAKHETDKLVQTLKSTKFSILLDESTDISDVKTMCLLVRYVVNWKVHTRLLELITLDARDCSAVKLFEAVENCFTAKGIPMKNILGVASDGAAVMIGRHNSFFSKLAERVPHVVLLRCICHSSAIISGNACKELPRSPEDLVRSIATYISGSAKRCAILREFQEFFHEQQRKILKVSATRWLSMQHCINQILENWTSLLNFFQLAVAEDHLKAAEHILTEMQSPLNKENFFNHFNALFQSRNLLIHTLYDSSLLLLRQLCQNFIKPEVIANQSDLCVINFNNPAFYKTLNNIALGPKAQEHLGRDIPANLRSPFICLCLKFYIKSAEELQKRLPIGNSMFKEFKFLTPKIALNENERTGDESLMNLPLLCNAFQTVIDTTKAIFEWQTLPSTFDELEKDKLINLPVEEFWKSISETKRFDETFLFLEICKLANIVLTMPHSNAEAERIFSVVTDCKTKKRNCLGSDTLNAMAVFRSAKKDCGENCATFIVEQEHISLHNQQLYSFKN